MNRLISASAFLCSTLGLVLMILACFLVPHHVVLGDDPGGTRACASPLDCNQNNCLEPPCSGTGTQCKTGLPECKDCICEPDGPSNCNCR
jgi:hypothetical protein